MRALTPILFAALVAGAANPACPGHGKVYNSLTKYSSSEEFCSTQLGIFPVTKTVSTTSVATTTTTTTIKSGATVSTASAVTSTSTASTTRTTTVTTTSTRSLSGSASTIITTVTKISGAKIAACASASSTGSTLSTSKAKVKRATTSFSKSTPSQLTTFSDSNLSAGCSCLNLTTKTVTDTTTLRLTSTYIRSTTTLGSTTVTTPTSRAYVTLTVISTITSTVISTSGGSATAVTSTTTTTVAFSTASSFFIKGSNGRYVSLANLSGGGMYLDSNTTKEADSFRLNSANELVVTTNGSQYLGFFAVGTPTAMDSSTDWYQMEVTDDGVDYDRRPLCCSITSTSALVCDYGELFGLCADGALYEGSQDAPDDDYYYDALQCKAVTLSVVAK